ncbi:non-ribosomal peptide synthetase [Flavobacterium sp. Leaf82]|uniref:non-ribosomal peptide synthetase n=1 Tax=Flavobacterium sp. Leaf82 TaxID=1736238 RepID=UPI0009E9A9DE|nr:non-ribosomal peptide synthetase [Flavobacterium sp. Leaf82]
MWRDYILEKEELLNGFNNTKADYPQDKTIIDLFEQQVLQAPDKVALKDDFKFYSYSELDKLSNKIATYLIDTFGENDKSGIAVLLDRSVDMVAVLLGILKSGRSYIPLDPVFPKDRLRYIVENSKSKILIGENKYELEGTENLSKITLEDILERTNRFEGNLPVTISPEDTAYIIYTSGSTGNPKGVEIGHHSLLNFLSSMQQKPGISSKDIFFSVTTYSFDISILEFFGPLISGATLYVANQKVLSDPSLIIEKLEHIQPTIIQATPSFYQLLFNMDWHGNKKTKMLCGGDLLSEALAKVLLDRSLEVWNMYGPTETTIWSSVKKIEQFHDASNIGTPINNTQIYILDEFLQPLPIAVSGGIYISGDGLAKGYYKNVELTQKGFIKNPFDDKRLLYKTGDVGKWNYTGEIEFLGRNDNQIKIRGYRIELGDIEKNILKYSENLKQVVLELKEVNNEKVLVAYFVSAINIDKSELRRFLQQRLPDYMVPNFYIKLEKLPLTPNGKTNRKALPNIEEKDIIKKEFVAPRNHTEERLVLIWKEVLNIEEIGVTDNFFELGGHSLNAMVVIKKIITEFNIEISIGDILFKREIQAIAAIIDEKEWLHTSLDFKNEIII